MARVVAESGVAYVAMHWRGHSDQMRSRATYADVVSEVVDELRLRLAGLVADGVEPDQVVLDPGLGFAKRPQHDWTLLRNLDAFAELGRPVLVGASRKSFLGSILVGRSGTVPPEQRDPATTAVTALAAAKGAYAVRVHDVAANRQAIAVADAWGGERW